MGSMPIVVIFVLGQDKPQVRLVPHEGPAEDLPTTRADPPLHDRVRARRPHRALDDPDTGALEHRVEGGYELAVPIADEKLDQLSMPIEVHQDIPCLLGHPRRGQVFGDAQDMDAPGRVFDHR
jgi:hypothetical protein